MAKQLKYPKLKEEAEQIVGIKQEKFGAGAFGDVPAGDIPTNGVARLVNQNAYEDYLEGRVGSRLFSSIPLPRYKKWFSARQEGDIITASDTHPPFEDADIGSFFVWGDGRNFEITEVLSVDEVRVRTKATISHQTNSWIRGRIYGHAFHYGLKKHVLHSRDRVYTANWNLSGGWTQVLNLMRETVPNKSKSEICEQGDYFLMTNANGVWKGFIDTSSPYMFRQNAPIKVATKPGSQNFSSDLSFQRRYLFCPSRLKGTLYTDNRFTENTKIEVEAGPVISSGDDVTDVDYTEANFRFPLGIKGVLTGATGITTTIATWIAITDGSINMVLFGETHNLQIDFTGVKTLAGVAGRLQTACRDFWPLTTVVIRGSGGSPRVEVTTGDVNGTIAVATDGTGGTNIADDLKLRGADGATADNTLTEMTSESEGVIVFLEPPAVEGDSNIDSSVAATRVQYKREAHWTHWGIYSTLEIGDKRGGREGTSKVIYIWMADIPMQSAFTASRTGSTVTATRGVFRKEDVGATLGFANNNTAVIESFTSSTVVETTTSGAIAETGVALNEGATPYSSKTLFATQSGDRVIVTAAHSSGAESSAIKSTDEQMPVYWADGTISVIRERISDTEFIVFDNIDRPEQGASVRAGAGATTTDLRTFNDFFSDVTLRGRLSTGKLTIPNRFWEPLPVSNLGVLTPGFFCVARRGDKDMFYTSFPSDKEYLIGYHNPDRHFDDSAEEPIQRLSRFPDKLVAYCSRSTYVTNTNTPLFEKLPDVGETIVILPNLQLVDDIGTTLPGSIRKIDEGKDFLITSEPAARIFDGMRYSKNLAELRLMEKLRKSAFKGFANYDYIGGYHFFTSEKN